MVHVICWDDVIGHCMYVAPSLWFISSFWMGMAIIPFLDLQSTNNNGLGAKTKALCDVPLALFPWAVILVTLEVQVKPLRELLEVARTTSARGAIFVQTPSARGRAGAFCNRATWTAMGQKLWAAFNQSILWGMVPCSSKQRGFPGNESAGPQNLAFCCPQH